jgi:hypothetical protein
MVNDAPDEAKPADVAGFALKGGHSYLLPPCMGGVPLEGGIV